MKSIQRGQPGQGGPSPDGREKDTLFCPVCGHESTARGGDWAVTERDAAGDRVRAYECPDCWTVVVTQPLLDAAD